MKRLRKAFPDQQIRFFAVGEYGRKCKHGIDLTTYDCPLCNTGRPHFHACIFNLSFSDLEAYQSDGGVMRYTSPTLEKLWGYGFVDVGELNYNSAAYCAKYILKKVKAANDDHHYMTYDMNGEITFITPEFTMMSRGNASHKGRKCGIGAGWYEKYKDDVFPDDETPVPGFGVMKGVPRYYYDMLKDENPELYENVKRKRLQWMFDNKEEFTAERLETKAKCKKAKLELFDSKIL
jgi:ribosomal protein L15